MVNSSTEYYRENRTLRKTIYNCPNCNYSTPNSQIQLTNHINAKHKSEKERPYQCSCCERGFAQKSHLLSHKENIHGIKEEKLKRSAVLYFITVTEKAGKSKKTKARQRYYINNTVIKSTDLTNLKHEYLDGIYLKRHELHYDFKHKFISLQKCSLWKKVY